MIALIGTVLVFFAGALELFACLVVVLLDTFVILLIVVFVVIFVVDLFIFGCTFCGFSWNHALLFTA